MSFFDKKQEVISIELTQYGKYLLSKGKFKPSYYEFIDDDILYDSEYGSFEENNSDISNRIRNETPSLKPQYVFSGIETKIQEAYELLRTGKISLTSDNIQQTPEKHYFSSAPLGNSDLLSNTAPSWNVNFLNGNIKSVKNFVTGAMPNMHIPEINVETIRYKLKKAKAEEEFQNLPNESVSVTFDDNSYIRIIGESLVLELKEENTPVMNSNFEIEFFLQEEDTTTNEQKLIPLYFPVAESAIKNNILVGEESQQISDFIADPKYLEYFFTVNVDSQISEDIKNKLPDSKQTETQVLVSNNNSLKTSK